MLENLSQNMYITNFVYGAWVSPNIRSLAKKNLHRICNEGFFTKQPCFGYETSFSRKCSKSNCWLILHQMSSDISRCAFQYDDPSLSLYMINYWSFSNVSVKHLILLLHACIKRTYKCRKCHLFYMYTLVCMTAIQIHMHKWSKFTNAFYPRVYLNTTPWNALNYQFQTF